MLNWLKGKMYGEGKIRLVGNTKEGQEFSVVVPYYGDLSSISEKDFILKCLQQIRVENGVDVAKIRIDSGYGTTINQPNWTYNWFYLKESS